MIYSTNTSEWMIFRIVGDYIVVTQKRTRRSLILTVEEAESLIGSLTEFAKEKPIT